MGRPVYIDSFSVLDDIPAKRRRDPVAVLSALDSAGRFSAFDIDAGTGAAISMIQENGWAEFEKTGYPWTDVSITPAGREVLKETNQ